MAAENNIVGEVGLIVKPVDPGFNAGVQRIIDKIERESQFKIGADTKQAEQSVQQLSNEVSGLNNKLVDAAINVAGVTAAFFALRGAVNKTLSVFGGLFDQLAQAQAGFTSILKSEAAGSKLLDDIREFARVSPFVTQELVNYSQQLLGVGLSAEKIVPLLEDVGNIVSSVGGDTQNIGRVLFTLTQIQSIGRLAGQDAMQLQSALIPITKYLSEFLGKTTAEVKKLQEQGKISAETVFQAISIQGDKVEGAMANATRNIAGARAILSDTITILLQEQPVLQEIFEDIFRSILKFADYLGTPEVRLAIDEFFVQVGKVYEAVKPLGEALASLGGSAGLSSLSVLTTLLGTLATVLNAIPEPVLKAVAAVFVSLSVLKAPLMLVQYVVSLRDLGARALQASFTLKKTTADIEAQGAAATKAANANNALAASQTNVARAGILNRASGVLQRNAGAVGPIGLGAAGALISDGQGGTRDFLGTTATTAALGAAVAGPWGLAAGAAIGAISGIVSMSKRAAEDIKKQAGEARDAWALEVTDAIAANFNNEVNTESLTEYFKKVGLVNDEIIENRRLTIQAVGELERLSRTQAAAPSIRNEGTVFESLPALEQMVAQGTGVGTAVSQAEVEKYRASVEDAIARRDALLSDPTFAAALEGVSAKIAKLAAANEGLFRVEGPRSQGFIEYIDVLTGQDIPRTSQEFAQLDRVLAQMGLTIGDFDKSEEEIQRLIDVFRSVPNAILDAEKAAQSWNKAYGDAAAKSSLFTDEQVKQINTQIGFQNAVSTTLGSVTKAAEDQTNTVAQLTATRDALTLGQQAYNQAIANGYKEVDALRVREEALALSQSARSSAQSAIAAQASLQTEQRIVQLLELAGLADTLDNREIVMTVTANGIAEIQAQINALITSILTMQTATPGSTPAARRREQVELRDLKGQLRGVKQQYDELVEGTKDGALADQIKLTAAARDRASAGAGGGGGGGGGGGAASAANQYAQNVKASTERLATALEEAARSIEESSKQWIGSIKERTEYEQAVSASRLIGNAQRQTADLSELSSGIANLRSRGVTQDVLDALGINNISDLRQVRKLVGASDAELATLTQSVGGLNAAAVDLAAREQDKRTRENITQAILDAAETLGLDVSKSRAESITNQFNITADMNPEEVALRILGNLTSGRIG